MQMFNGLTMGIFSPYMVNFDVENSEKGNDNTSENYDTKLSEYTTKINEITKALTDEDNNNDENAKQNGMELLRTLNGSFDESVKNYFKNNPDKLKEFKATIESSIQMLKDKHEGNLPNEYTPLQDLLNKINTEFSDILVDKDQKLPELNLKGIDGLNGIQQIESDDGKSENKKGEQNFFKGIDNRVEGGESKLDETKSSIKGQIDKINKIDINQLPDNHKATINSLKGLLGNIDGVINNTTTENVKKLQSFISDNLDGKDKDNFDNINKAKIGFDGMFGSGTLDGLNKVLDKTGKYIEDTQEYLKSINNGKLNKVRAKSDVISIKKGDKIEASTLLDENSLPEGATVKFKENEEDKLNNPSDQEQDIILIVDLGGETQEVKVKVKVEETNNKSGSSSETTNDKGPLTVGEGDSSKNCPVVENSPQIASSLGLPGCTIYYTESATSKTPTTSSPEVTITDGSQPTESVDKKQEITPFTNENGRTEYYLKGKGDKIYKIEVKGNTLFPIIREIDTKTGKEKESKLIENNNACICYLQDQIPNGLGNISIKRNEKKKDYAVYSHNTRLTIEPMTIDSNWVSKDLSKCIALLNFTNFLRTNSEIDQRELKGRFPDVKAINDKLYVRVKKKTNNKEKRYPIPERFCLNLRGDELSKYQKYNNHEEWRDNWDRKKENRYGKIQISEIKINTTPATVSTTGASTGSSPDVTTTGASAGNSPDVTNNGASAGNSPDVTNNGASAGNSLDVTNNGASAGNSLDVTNNGASAGNSLDVTNNSDNICEIPTDLWDMSDDQFKELSEHLGENMFIEKTNDGKITYDLDKLKNHLTTIKDLEWGQLKSTLGHTEGVAWISAVQIALLSLKFNVEKIDGNYDSSINVVKKFQAKYKLKQDGGPGSNTITKILEVLNGGVQEGTKGKGNIDNSEDSEGTGDIDNSEVTEHLIGLDDLKNIDINSLGGFKGNEFKFKDGIEKTDGDQKYIEIGGKKFYNWEEGCNGLRYDIAKNIDGSYGLYIGEYKNGLGHGYMRITYNKGDNFIGEIKNNEADGRGTYKSKSGDKYEGNWRNGKKYGKGVSTYANGDKYEGNWINSKKDGQGVYTFANGDKYKGNWKNDKRDGQGVYTFANGEKYEGNWKNDKKDGQGVYTYANGDKYIGNWRNGNIDGGGTKTYANGDKYEGNWKNNKAHGYGIKTYEDGHTVEGIWIDGKFDSEKTKYYEGKANQIFLELSVYSTSNWKDDFAFNTLSKYVNITKKTLNNGTQEWILDYGKQVTVGSYATLIPSKFFKDLNRGREFINGIRSITNKFGNNIKITEKNLPINTGIGKGPLNS